MAKAPTRAKAKLSTPKAVRAKDKAIVITTPALVAFSYQDVSYQIDVARSKVYRRFIEIEKSKQYSIINAYRGTRPAV